MAPVITDAVSRIETKTTKAFANKAGKSPQERTIWSNVFAEEQARFVVESFTPINTVLTSAGAKALDIDRVSQRYSAAVRSMAAGADAKSLSQIIEESQQGVENVEA